MNVDKKIEAYLIAFRRDLEVLRNSKYTGNIEFKINLKEGGIANVNCARNKSIKLSDEQIEEMVEEYSGKLIVE